MVIYRREVACLHAFLVVGHIQTNAPAKAKAEAEAEANTGLLLFPVFFVMRIASSIAYMLMRLVWSVW